MTNFFDANSPYLAHPLLTPDRSMSEAVQLIKLLDLPKRGEVLDVGCGFGRHTIALTALRYPTTGIDPSAAMIAAAKKAAPETPSLYFPNFRKMRGQDLYHTAEFDGAICMFTSLGQVEASDQSTDNRALLPKVAAALRPGSRFVVEVPVRDHAISALVAEEGFGDAENGTQIQRRFDETNNRMVEQFLVTTAGQTNTFDLSYTLFSPQELVELLESAGFQVAAVRSTLVAANEAVVDTTADQAPAAKIALDTDQLAMVAVATVS